MSTINAFWRLFLTKIEIRETRLLLNMLGFRSRARRKRKRRYRDKLPFFIKMVFMKKKDHFFKLIWTKNMKI